MNMRRILHAHALSVGLLLARTAMAAEMVAIGDDDINMRSGPGTGHEILWKLDSGFPLEVVGAKGEWLQVRDFEGSSGWVHKKTTQKTAFVIVKANKGTNGQINVRKEPNLTADIVANAGYGVVFKVLQKQDGWVKVAHGQEGVTGWVDGRLLWGM
ncbi:MAG: SH3 domain-containing protein [Desulfobulbus sp.]|nr:SH3 domain-containing protein [Desulfobulbus sp.]